MVSPWAVLIIHIRVFSKALRLQQLRLLAELQMPPLLLKKKSPPLSFYHFDSKVHIIVQISFKEKSKQFCILHFR